MNERQFVTLKYDTASRLRVEVVGGFGLVTAAAIVGLAIVFATVELKQAALVHACAEAGESLPVCVERWDE